MRRTLTRCAIRSAKQNDSQTLIRIDGGTFYRRHPSSSQQESESHTDNQPLFPDLGFILPSFSSPVEKWSVLSKSSAARTTFLQILRGQHICIPPTARSYPYLAGDEIAQKDSSLRSVHNAIRYVGFDADRGQFGAGGTRGAYLSARYESLRENTDISLLDFLMGNTELNADERLVKHPDQWFLERIMKELGLDELAELPVTHLSNGQTRRAKIAKALLAKPEVLLLDGPFMGLDPPSVKHLSQILGDLAESQAPRFVLSLKPDEHIPEWITHLAFITQKFELGKAGPRYQVIRYIHEKWEESKYVAGSKSPKKVDEAIVEYAEVSRHLWAHMPNNPTFDDRREETAYQREYKELTKDNETAKNSAKKRSGLEVISRDGFRCDTNIPHPGEPIVEMDGVKVQYGEKIVLGDWKQDIDGTLMEGLWWKIRRGQRWGVFGPNGSGKTTLISLITSDHPQTYSLPIKLFGRTRLPEPGQPGISIFDLQKRIGHSSPEVHVFFPKHLSLRKTIESAWADTPLTKPKLSFDIDGKVNAALAWFRAELMPSLGPPTWMRREMDRSVQGIDTGHFDLRDEPRGHKKLAYSLRVSHEEILREMQEIEGDQWADHVKFGELSFSAQRVALFIRAVIRNPDLVILDEAFSGMDDFARDKCHLFLSQGENAMIHLTRKGSPTTSPKIRRSDLNRFGLVKVHGLQESQVLLVVSHKKEEVPGCVRDWLCLPEGGRGEPRFGHLNSPLELNSSGWKEIWGEPVERAIERRKQRLDEQRALKSHIDWHKESQVERDARLARRRALVTLALNNLPADLADKFKDIHTSVTRNRVNSSNEPALLREKRKLMKRLAWAAELPEEKERRLRRRRIRRQVSSTSVSRVEQLSHSRERNAKYLGDRPDGLEHRRKLNREAAKRHREKMSDEQRQANNKKRNAARTEKIANMTETEKQLMKATIATNYRERMQDPAYKQRWRDQTRARMRRYRARQKETIKKYQRSWNRPLSKNISTARLSRETQGQAPQDCESYGRSD